jgi:hypothetical protein
MNISGSALASYWRRKPVPPAAAAVKPVSEVAAT